MISNILAKNARCLEEVRIEQHFLTLDCFFIFHLKEDYDGNLSNWRNESASGTYKLEFKI